MIPIRTPSQTLINWANSSITSNRNWLIRPSRANTIQSGSTIQIHQLIRLSLINKEMLSETYSRLPNWIPTTMLWWNLHRSLRILLQSTQIRKIKRYFRKMVVKSAKTPQPSKRITITIKSLRNKMLWQISIWLLLRCSSSKGKVWM